jgi:dipeptidyl aminopeptidase/acylaminoacyl peptidase
MRKLIFTCGVLIIAPILALAQAKRPMSYDDVMGLKTVAAAAISPDGKWVAYTVSYNEMKENERRTEIWMTSTTGGAGSPVRRFTSGKNDTSPQWSPDGERLAFISSRAGSAGSTPRAQIYLISPFGGEADQLTDSKTGVGSFVWSADGKRIAYISQTPLSEAEEKRQKDKDDAIVVDTNFRFTRLWTIDVGSKKATEVVKVDLVLSDPQWSPDGTKLSYTAHPTPRADDGSWSDLYIANADGSGSPRKLLTNDGPDAGARWSPDGKWISFSSRDRKNGSLGFQQLQIISADGGQPRAVAPTFDGGVPAVTWGRDGKTLYFLASQRTTSQIFAVPVAGGAVRPITAGEAIIGNYSLSRDGGKIALTRSDLSNPAEVFVAEAGKFNPVKLTDHNPQLKEIALGRGEVIRWKSKDGLEVEGILIYPSNYESGKRYPTIAAIHGGPAGAWTQSFPGGWNNYAHVWAGKGWVTFLPNVRGSSGYGEKFLLSNVRDWGGGDYQDIQTGLDELVKRGISDPDRMGQMGWSYGGYMTAWTLTQTNRFKAVMVGAGLTNMFSMYSTNDLQSTLEGYFGAEPWNDLDVYTRASAMTHIKKARTPTLILHGQNDTRVPIGQAQELYMGLKKNGVPVQLVFFPREGHGLAEPRHQLDKMRREYGWFAKYVLGESAAEEKTAPVASGNRD